MPIEYEKVYENKFTTPIESFTVQDIGGYGLLYILFSLDLRSLSYSDNSVVMYPNGDTGSNYTCTRFHYDDGGTSRGVNDPSANMHLCRVGWAARSLNEGYAYFYTRPTGYWRALHSRFTITPSNYTRIGCHDMISYWKNTTDTINNILFRVRQSGYGFTGWIKVYGLKI
jgi:hypothetical protein